MHIVTLEGGEFLFLSIFSVILGSLILSVIGLIKKKKVLAIISFTLFAGVSVYIILTLASLFYSFNPSEKELMDKLKLMQAPEALVDTGQVFILSGQLSFKENDFSKEDIRESLSYKNAPLTHRDSIAFMFEHIHVDTPIRDMSFMSYVVYIDSAMFEKFKPFTFDQLRKDNKKVDVVIKCIKLSEMEWEALNIYDIDINDGETNQLL